MKWIYLFLFAVIISACTKDNDTQSGPNNDSDYYFPPTDSEDWESKSMESLGWNTSEANNLFDFLSENGTRAFLVLHEGKIVMEEYWGNNIINTAPFEKNSNWYWASAGKTLTAFLVGLAQDQGFLNIEDKTSDYLGTNWTSLTSDKEELITIKHQLTMSTGLDYTVPNIGCTTPDCLQYKTDAGDQWYYHNAPYTLLSKVMANACNQTYEEFTNNNIEQPIGMNGTWVKSGDNNVYWSTPRDAARFGLLMLNKGKWDDTQILSNMDYYNSMINSSQTLNPAYGYCTWLNGKSSMILPGLPNSFPIALSDAAPSDLFAAMGKNGQYINVIPSKNLVIVRMGDAPDNALVPTVFHNDMWIKINAVID